MRNKDLKNHFLIAMPSINDPVFKKSLILICEDNQNGTMGLIVNKPIDNVLIKNMFLSSDIDDVYPAESKIYFGGPVNLDVGFVLHESNYHTDKTLNISNDLSNSILSLIADNLIFLYVSHLVKGFSLTAFLIIKSLKFFKFFFDTL